MVYFMYVGWKAILLGSKCPTKQAIWEGIASNANKKYCHKNTINNMQPILIIETE